MTKFKASGSQRRSCRVRRAAEAGFTLIEMLVVITIIGLIMALVAPRVLNYLGESEGEGRKNSDCELRQRP